MQLDQETLNLLFKELFNLDQLPNKDSEELTEQYEYYDNTERKFLKQFHNKQLNNESEVKLLHRFIARLAEAYQVLLAKKSIFRSKASTFQPTIYNCLSNMYDGKQGVFIQLIQSIFTECKLQLEIANRKLTNNDIVKRIHSQDQDSLNNESLQQQQQLSITQLLLQRKSTQPEWQTNINNNKNLSQYFKKTHLKLYDLLSIDKVQDDQILYFQSREQNMDKLFQQLMQQNTHIKKSLNWAVDLDMNDFEKHIQLMQIKQNSTSIPNIQFTPVDIVKTDQFDGQKTVSSFFSQNEQYKIRSFSQNSKIKDLYSFSEKINIFHPNYQDSIKYKISQSRLDNQYQQKRQLAQQQIIKQSPVVNMLTRKMIFEQQPQNSKKKTKSFRFKN
ncbi:unnamed protein product (macronuclear) [Paramecium tetraurelia]|uniref:Uncharacterized protein n=1 Tax=Paramecium tetraurelia TaxID=5888 RepID=A0EHL9_PARTE|nr:uncharacterized protein GSPATT00027136001 [Paramecium tetraurelia]CAK94810.1 unnamed protein product [Paramecium tetraurelia]|eukprot:XP_001462183.1 hypothetical protein (macronuclear) [Paramecium tetraurelia strain d4-2]